MRKNLWPQDISNAKKLQDILSKQVRIVPLERPPRYIAAVDSAFTEERITAVAVLYEYQSLRFIKSACFSEPVRMPYIPGLLTFREGHAVVNALQKLAPLPDLILFDGQGIAHPKGIGIASHIGVILDIPAIGCAKSRLVGDFNEPAAGRGRWTYLTYKNRKVGVVLRTRHNVKPVFVSPGHLTDIHSSRKIVMKCVSKYRIPEPLRKADYLSKKKKMEI